MNVAMRRRVPGRMTVDEFIAWCDDDALGKWQLVDGEPVLMSPAAVWHGRIQARLAALLDSHLETRGGSCVVLTEPAIRPRLRAGINLRVPDLAVTCETLQSGQIPLAEPVVIVEVLSPSNEPDTWDNVWTYASVPSVREILVVHSTRVLVELLRRQDDGGWAENPVRLGIGEHVELTSIGFGCDVASIYRGTPLVAAA